MLSRRPPRGQPAPAKKGSSAGPIIATLLALALVGGGVAWAYTAGLFDRSSDGGSTATTPRTTTVTTPSEVEETQEEVTETTTRRERTTITESRNPGTLRVEDTAPESAPAAPAEPARPETSAVQSTPEMAPPTSSAPEAGNQTTTAIDLPNLENLLGGGR